MYFLFRKNAGVIYICMYIYIHIYIQTFISIYFLHTQKYIELEIDRQILQGRKCRYKNIVIKIWHLIFICVLYIQQYFYTNRYLLQHTKPSKTELYRVCKVEHFHYSEQVVQRTQDISIISSWLYKVEHYCYFKYLMLSRTFLLFPLSYTEQGVLAISARLY